MLAQVVYIAYTPLGKKWRLCTRQLTYILPESWLHGVFRAYTTLKPRPSDVCSAYAPSRRRRAYALQTSSGLSLGRIYAEYTTQHTYVLYIPTHMHTHTYNICCTYVLTTNCCSKCDMSTNVHIALGMSLSDSQPSNTQCSLPLGQLLRIRP